MTGRPDALVTLLILFALGGGLLALALLLPRAVVALLVAWEKRADRRRAKRNSMRRHPSNVHRMPTDGWQHR